LIPSFYSALSDDTVVTDDLSDQASVHECNNKEGNQRVVPCSHLEETAQGKVADLSFPPDRLVSNLGYIQKQIFFF
jgi:hypothetical protein